MVQRLKKIVHKKSQVNEDAIHVYCKCCHRPINQRIVISNKLQGECNRCYRANTNKGYQRKVNKRRTLNRKAQRRFARSY